jgi:hypothetical protein
VRPDFSNCKNCGGILPLINSPNDVGTKPPPAPRELPKKYIRRIKYTGNVMSMIGFVFTVVFFWSIIFPIIGIFIWRKGLREAEEELIPLQSGTPVLGEIETIQRDYSKKMNGRSPLTVTFLFNANGQTHRGSVGNIFDNIDLTKKAGDKVWVVYMPENPQLSSIWPPLK